MDYGCGGPWLYNHVFVEIKVAVFADEFNVGVTKLFGVDDVFDIIFCEGIDVRLEILEKINTGRRDRNRVKVPVATN